MICRYLNIYTLEKVNLLVEQAYLLLLSLYGLFVVASDVASDSLEWSSITSMPRVCSW